MTKESEKSPFARRAKRRMRTRRASASGSDQKLRDRALWEVIEIASMLQNEGKLCEVKETDENYEEVASRELAVKLQISLNGAKKVLKLMGIAVNAEVWKFLKSSSRLGVFADSRFTKSYTSIKCGGGTLSIDFLEAFVNGADPNAHEGKLRQRGRTRKLDSISLRFTAEARDLCVSMFFKSVAVVSTLCSFVSFDTELDKLKLLDLVGRYMGESWTSDSMQREYHSNSSVVFLVDGWNIVSEVFKVQVQELMYWKEREEGESTDSSCDSSRITVLQLRKRGFQICNHVVCEFFAWCFQFVKEREQVDPFMDSLIDTMDDMCLKLSQEIGIDESDEDELAESAVKASLQSIYENQATMAEIKYDAKEMTPSRREARVNMANKKIAWKMKDVLMRCRWEGSPAEERYASFLKRAQTEEDARAKRCQQEEPTLPVQSEPNETIIPETPEPNKAGRNVGKRSHTERDGEDNRDGLEEEAFSRSRKRVKESYVQISRRLGVAAQEDRIERGRKLKEVYADDGESSDEERLTRDPEDNVGIDEEKISSATNLTVQLLYETILDWPVLPVPLHEIEKERLRNAPPLDLDNPITKAERSAGSDLLTNDQRWVRIYCERRSSTFFRDVTSAPAMELYAEHWRHVIPFEIRGMVSEAISDLLPSVKEDPRAKWTKDIKQDRFLRLKVHKVSMEKGVVNTVCKSVQPLLNKEIAMKLQGGTICLGYVGGSREVPCHDGTVRKKEQQFSTLVLFVCRRVHWKDEDVIPLADTQAIDELELHIAVSRARTRHIQGVWEGDCLQLLQLCPLSPHLRMFKSVQEAHRLPEKMANLLCGPKCPRVPADSELDARIDPGCNEYLRGVKLATGMIDDSQLGALHTVLGNIGTGEKGSSSLSLIQGPPGTGKTTLLNILIGALLHHSKYGHVGRNSVHPLREQVPKDGILRRSVDPQAFRILICCGSNQAVDNILRRMDNRGIPDGKGGSLHPQSVRLARQAYNYGDLKQYSIDAKALPFDRLVHHMNEPNRKCASTKARRSLSKELILGFVTHSSSGGARVKNMKMGWDIILIDEACQSWEPETLIPLTTSLRRNEFGRCHVVLSGDPAQLKPMISAEMLMRKSKPPFEYLTQMMSLFERVHKGNRAPFKMLLKQYRMHPAISSMHSRIFYNGLVQSPLPSSKFEECYNLGWDDKTRRFAPITLIDTSTIPTRFEWNDQKGSVCNPTEINIMDEVLDDIKRLAGDQFEKLRKQIAVLVPYRAQVSQAKVALSRFGKYNESGGVSRQGFQMLVGTVDAMQGAQRDIVIFAATRSNSEQSLGFVDRANRLNVAVSRSSKLLVIIADMSTLSVSREFAMFWKHAAQGSNGAALVVKKMRRNSGGTGHPEQVIFNPKQIEDYMIHAARKG